MSNHDLRSISNEFFKIPGKWPLSFTLWRYNYKEDGNNNRIKVRDYTYLKRDDLAEIKRIKEIEKTPTQPGTKVIRQRRPRSQTSTAEK